MSTIINGTSSAITFPDTTVQNTAFTTGAVTQSTIATGVAGTGPAFSAYANSTTSIANATYTKVGLQLEEFDTANAFDSTTNYRFQPQVAGYYQLNFNVFINTSANATLATIYKNGSQYKVGTYTNFVTGAGGVVGGACLVYLNGSTDYVELYAFQNSGSTANIQNSQSYTYFQGSMVRAA